MVRAAAKNHASVGVVTDPSDYPAVLDELRAAGSLSAATRRRLARAAFAAHRRLRRRHRRLVRRPEPTPRRPRSPSRPGEGGGPALRREPPPAGRPLPATALGWWDGVVQHGGMALSYLNLLDAEAAWPLVHDLRSATRLRSHHQARQPVRGGGGRRPGHRLPAGVRVRLESAFGGIVALNRPVDEDTVAAMGGGPGRRGHRPAYEPGRSSAWPRSARTPGCWSARPGRRRLAPPPASAAGSSCRSPTGSTSTVDLAVVTRPRPPTSSGGTPSWPGGCAATPSPTPSSWSGGQAVGIGAGQQSRVDAAEIAAQKADGRAKGGVAPPTLLPFRDGSSGGASGAAAVVQPGGSIRDDEVIAAADEAGIAMVFTGGRHFRH